jgi:hypothetical protein
MGLKSRGTSNQKNPGMMSLVPEVLENLNNLDNLVIK